MINIKYKELYDTFINHYKKVHVCPWHEISEEELDKIYTKLVNDMDINDNGTFCYFMNYIIKRLSGLEDAHTQYDPMFRIPMNFRIIDDEVLVNYPNELRGSSVISINGVGINDIFIELDDILTYGTEGRRISETEKALFNKLMLFGLPSFRNSEELVFKIKKLDGEIIEKHFDKKEKYIDEAFDLREYLYERPGKYQIIGNALVYKHSSLQDYYKEDIINSIERLRKEDLSNIKRIIIDLRGNTGGNSKLTNYLLDFLKENNDKELFVLTGYKVFSAGRFALMELVNMGATTIGEEIGTPINSFGETNRMFVDKYSFASSSAYYYPGEYDIKSKEEFNKTITKEIRIPHYFKPDIYVKTNKEDYINGVDTILDFTLNYNVYKKNK